MLNGVAPVLIFTFPVNLSKYMDYFGGSVLDYVPSRDDVGIPIPVYLDEKLTGVMVDSESKSVDIQTTVEAKTVGGTPDYSQRAIDSLISIDLSANKNSPMLSALIALCDMAFQRVASREYKVSYLNGPTTVFNGLLHGFQVNTEGNSELMTMTLQLSKSTENLNNPPTPTMLPKITGAIPIRGA